MDIIQPKITSNSVMQTECQSSNWYREELKKSNEEWLKWLFERKDK